MFKNTIFAVSAFKRYAFNKSALAVDKLRFANFKVGTLNSEKVAFDANRTDMEALDALIRVVFVR